MAKLTMELDAAESVLAAVVRERDDATARAVRADVLVAWARSRIAECRRQEAKFGAGDVAIEASTERRALQAVLSMLGRDEG